MFDPATSGGSSADETRNADKGTVPHNSDNAATVATSTLEVSEPPTASNDTTPSDGGERDTEDQVELEAANDNSATEDLPAIGTE